MVHSTKLDNGTQPRKENSVLNATMNRELYRFADVKFLAEETTEEFVGLIYQPGRSQALVTFASSTLATGVHLRME